MRTGHGNAGIGFAIGNSKPDIKLGPGRLIDNVEIGSVNILPAGKQSSGLAGATTNPRYLLAHSIRTIS